MAGSWFLIMSHNNSIEGKFTIKVKKLSPDLSALVAGGLIPALLNFGASRKNQS